MDALLAAHPVLVPWVILPLFFFVARTTDVGLSTLRIAFIAQGRIVLAPVIGFFEALIWLLVIGQALKFLDNPLCVVAYAGGFAMGNVFGLTLERRLAFGRQIVRIIVSNHPGDLIDTLRTAGHGVTVVDGEGMSGPVKILFTVVRRREVPAVLAVVRAREPRAFVSIEDVRRAEEGVFLRGRPRSLPGLDWSWLRLRKGK